MEGFHLKRMCGVMKSLQGGVLRSLMTRVVLDASAVTAVLRSEQGSENVIPLLRGALISAVNLAEVFCTARAGIPIRPMMKLPFN